MEEGKYTFIDVCLAADTMAAVAALDETELLGLNDYLAKVGHHKGIVGIVECMLTVDAKRRFFDYCREVDETSTPPSNTVAEGIDSANPLKKNNH